MVAFWVPALYYYNQNQTSWTETPADSRTYNQPCILFDFFDRHDVWHLCELWEEGGGRGGGGWYGGCAVGVGVCCAY